MPTACIPSDEAVVGSVLLREKGGCRCASQRRCATKNRRPTMVARKKPLLPRNAANHIVKPGDGRRRSTTTTDDLVPERRVQQQKTTPSAQTLETLNDQTRGPRSLMAYSNSRQAVTMSGLFLPIVVRLRGRANQMPLQGRQCRAEGLTLLE